MEKDKKISNLGYFSDLVSGDREMILEIIDTFLTQIIEESEMLNNAILKIDYKTIKTNAHSMKSTLSIVGAVTLLPMLIEIEKLALDTEDIEKIIELTHELDKYVKQVLREIEQERENYV